MARMIFVNLPVVDLDRSKAFYSAWASRTSRASPTRPPPACGGRTIYVMLLTHPKWQSFTSRPIPSSDSSEVMLALNCDSQQEVDRLTDAAGRNGASPT